MDKPAFIELVLTCISWQRAQDAADKLFERKLAEQVEVMLTGNNQKINLIVQARPDYFAKIKSIVEEN